MKRIHFPDVDDKSKLSIFNVTYMVVLHLLRKERMKFHQVCTFPYNILVLVLESDNSDESFIESVGGEFRHTLRANRFYFIPTGYAVDYNLQPGIRYFTFHVGFEKFSGIDLYNTENATCQEGDASGMIRKMNRIWNERDLSRQACRVRALLLNFFLEHWPTEPEEPHSPEPRSPEPRLDRLLPVIQEQCNAVMTVESLAEKLEMNPDVFTRKFKNRFGMTPKTYLTRILVRKVMALLSDPKITLKRAAKKLSFSSEYYLSRFLKKNTGQSPSGYRASFSRR